MEKEKAILLPSKGFPFFSFAQFTELYLKFESSILTNYIDLLLSPFSGFLALNNVIILFLFFFQR